MSGRGGIYDGPNGPLHGDGQPVGKPVKQRMVKACNVCGHISMVSCHHNGWDIQTVPMSIEAATALIDKWIAGMEREVQDYKDHRARYHKS